MESCTLLNISAVFCVSWLSSHWARTAYWNSPCGLSLISISRCSAHSFQFSLHYQSESGILMIWHSLELESFVGSYTVIKSSSSGFFPSEEHDILHFLLWQWCYCPIIAPLFTSLCFSVFYILLATHSFLIFHRVDPCSVSFGWSHFWSYPSKLPL